MGWRWMGFFAAMLGRGWWVVRHLGKKWTKMVLRAAALYSLHSSVSLTCSCRRFVSIRSTSGCYSLNHTAVGPHTAQRGAHIQRQLVSRPEAPSVTVVVAVSILGGRRWRKAVNAANHTQRGRGLHQRLAVLQLPQQLFNDTKNRPFLLMPFRHRHHRRRRAPPTAKRRNSFQGFGERGCTRVHAASRQAPHRAHTTMRRQGPPWHCLRTYLSPSFQTTFSFHFGFRFGFCLLFVCLIAGHS